MAPPAGAAGRWVKWSGAVKWGVRLQQPALGALRHNILCCQLRLGACLAWTVAPLALQCIQRTGREHCQVESKPYLVCSLWGENTWNSIGQFVLKSETVQT